MEMPTANPRPPSPPPASRWNLISRIRKPFTQKARHISEFYIQPDDPHRQYLPGDVVTGNVVVKVVKPLDITHIVVCLHGFAQVYKTPNNPGIGYKEYNAALITGKTNKAGGYYGNGFLSLFEDEVVLCGDGRVGEGLYQFGFELHFPTEHAPSSIDFERGTITYMITSTLTRPTRASIINPIMSCERRVQFLDDIDIASLARPKPRVITLEPILRRSRTKSRRQPTPDPQLTPTAADAHRSRMLEPPSTNGQTLGHEIELPRSPEPSEDSFETILSSGGTPSAAESAAAQSQSARTTDSRFARSNMNTQPPTPPRKPITTSVELTASGFLRGDTIDIKIHINHTKQIKSLHGVIATLYRQARVDMHPALPIVRESDDDLYPRSRTGLGGLSLSSAGTSNLFRKDMDQAFGSIIINPETLSTEIKTILRVPEDAFPTIATVPGSMISFKYYVEIILDIQGKLTALDKFLPTPSVGSLSSNFPNNAPSIGVAGAHANYFTGWVGHSINTEDIKREKSVVSCSFEVVIGSRDSKRTGRWKNLFPTSVPNHEPSHTLNIPEVIGPHAQTNGANGHHIRRANSHIDSLLSPPDAGTPRPRSATATELQTFPPRPATATRRISFPPQHESAPEYEATTPRPHFPIPDIRDESHLSEKERIRRAEQRLLPSAPPGAEGESSSVGAEASHAPTAPELPQLAPLHQLSSVLNGLSHAPSATPLDEAPAYEGHEPAEGSTSNSRHIAASDDKQELERRRLQAERSAPPSTPSNTGAQPQHNPHDVASGTAHIPQANGLAITTPSSSRANALSSSSPNPPSAPSIPPGVSFTTAPSAPPSSALMENDYTPSAPILNEEEDVYGFNVQTRSHHQDGDLPRYER